MDFASEISGNSVNLYSFRRIQFRLVLANLSTVMMLAKGFDMTLIEFLDDELFTSDALELE